MKPTPSAIHRFLNRAYSGACLLLLTATPAAFAADSSATSGLPSVQAESPAVYRHKGLEADFRLHARLIPKVIELESLLPDIVTSAGEASQQAMAGFGSGWGAGAQLFWRPPAPVDTPIRNWPNLRLYPQPPKAGRYRVTLVHTVAPDYGTVRVFLKGQPVKDFDAYASSVMPRRLELGEFQLSESRFELLFTVFTRNPSSSNYFVGLDRIELLALD